MFNLLVPAFSLPCNTCFLVDNLTGPLIMAWVHPCGHTDQDLPCLGGLWVLLGAHSLWGCSLTWLILDLPLDPSFLDILKGQLATDVVPASKIFPASLCISRGLSRYRVGPH